MQPTAIHREARIGHVHLRVADLERATTFYRDVIGFDVTARLPGAAFLAAGDYHHHIALNTWASEGGPPAPNGHAGLHHFAVLLPDEDALAEVVGRVLAAGHPIDGALDHGASVAVYLRDPDGNGIELSYDRPQEGWYDGAGRPIMKSESFDPLELLVGWSEPARPEAGRRP